MTQPTAVPRAQIWATLVLGSMEARLPAPKAVHFGGTTSDPLVTLEFDTRAEADLWGRWLPADTVLEDYLYAGRRCEWTWHLMWLDQPGRHRAVAAAIPDADVSRPMFHGEAASPLDDDCCRRCGAPIRAAGCDLMANLRASIERAKADREALR